MQNRKSLHAMARLASCIILTSITPAHIKDDDHERRKKRRHPAHRTDPIRNFQQPHQLPRFAAPLPPVFMTFGAVAQNARSPISMIYCFLVPQSRATRSKATAKNVRPRVKLGTRFAANPIELDIPVTIAGMSFGALSGPAKEALGPRCISSWHLNNDRRWRHDTRRARAFIKTGLSISALALWYEPR